MRLWVTAMRDRVVHAREREFADERRVLIGAAERANRRRERREELGARGSEESDANAFVVEDGRYISARWPGDAWAFARAFVRALDAAAATSKGESASRGVT